MLEANFARRQPLSPQQTIFHLYFAPLLRRRRDGPHGHTKTMSIGTTMTSTGISARSPGKHQNSLEDVELGSSSHHSGNAGMRHGSLKAKNSDVTELQPLTAGNGDGPKAPTSPRAGQGEDHASSSTAKSVIASAMYSGCSVGMVLVNKSLASRCVTY